jgi:hypothetical protein
MVNAVITAMTLREAKDAAYCLYKFSFIIFRFRRTARLLIQPYRPNNREQKVDF